MAKNNLEVGMRCIKYMLLCITAMFVLTSALIISVGTTIYAIYHDISYFLHPNTFSPATMIVVIGVIMLFVSLFGCVGALKESTCLVNIFAFILSLVLVVEVAAVIVAFTTRAQVPKMLDDSLRFALPSYYKDAEVKGAFDFMQSRMNCCGVESYLDWGNALPEDYPGISVSNITVPNSCCSETRTTFYSANHMEVTECLRTYSNGCGPRIILLVYQSSGLLGTAAMTIAFIQIIGIIFSFTLASAIRKAKTEREHRRWQIKEQMINSPYASLNPNDHKIPATVYVPFHGQTNA